MWATLHKSCHNPCVHKCIWNTSNSVPIVPSPHLLQVCNLAWSRSTNEVVSTHGYSQNQIILWRYPSLTQVARLTGHTTRVLYLVSVLQSPVDCCMYIQWNATPEIADTWTFLMPHPRIRTPHSLGHLTD